MSIRRTTDAGNVIVTFVLTDDAPDGPVSVVGSFNDWEPGAHPFEPDATGTRAV